MHHNHSRHFKKPCLSSTSEHIFIDSNKHTIHLLFRQLSKVKTTTNHNLQVLLYELRTFLCTFWFRYKRTCNRLVKLNNLARTMYTLNLDSQDFFCRILTIKFDCMALNHCKVNIISSHYRWNHCRLGAKINLVY